MTDLPTMDALARDAAKLRLRIPAGETAQPHRIGLYGNGFLGRWAVDHLRSIGIQPMICFDGDPAKQGGMVQNVPVVAFSAPPSEPLDAVLITARHAVCAVAPILEQHGLAACPFDGWYVAHHFAEFAALHDTLFTDAQSRRTLRAMLHAMMTGDPLPLQSVLERDQYFCLPHFTNPGRDYYVDAGAFVGDSVERFIWANGGAFKKIWAFEPFERQYRALQTRTHRLLGEWALDESDIELVQAGLGAASGARMLKAGGSQMQSAALTAAGEGDVPILALDDYLGGQPVTFIKADVEGMEMALIEGAAHTIAKFRPKLAICVYHYPCDLLDIVERIKSYVPDYTFALRHHSSQQMETVLYAWVD